MDGEKRYKVEVLGGKLNITVSKKNGRDSSKVKSFNPKFSTITISP
jgi:hypothetical protein